jgi:hypothetical protein
MGLGSRLRRAWAALPWWARWVLAVYLIGFADGTAAHARNLARAGFDAYSGFPQVPLRVFFISLVFLDPPACCSSSCSARSCSPPPPPCSAPPGSCEIQRRIPGPIPHDKSGRVRPDHVRVQCYHRDNGAVELGRQAG